MPEIITGPGLLLAVGAKLVNDVCGPSAKYLGKELASYTKKGVHNLRHVFGNAAKKLQIAGKRDGTVPPRVLKSVLQEGYFCEDQLQGDYLGGILASSKGPISRDDRAVTYTALLSGLSSYQVRTHYLLYSAILRTKRDRLDRVLEWMLRGTGITVAIEADSYISAMEFSETKTPAPSSSTFSQAWRSMAYWMVD